MLPYDSEWCEENGIAISTCYVEASVDVTNNMWLFKPPTALGFGLRLKIKIQELLDKAYMIISIEFGPALLAVMRNHGKL